MFGQGEEWKNFPQLRCELLRRIFQYAEKENHAICEDIISIKMVCLAKHILSEGLLDQRYRFIVRGFTDF